MRKKDWEIYEDMVNRILRSKSLSFTLDDGRECSFSKSIIEKKPVYGKGKNCKIKHQIDVQLFNEEDNIYLYGECKFHTAPISKAEVSAFIKIIENIRDGNPNKTIVPIYICSSAFNEGAIKMMEQYGCCYLIILPDTKNHFIESEVKIKRYKIKNKWYEYSGEGKDFYNGYHGTNENLASTVNMFLTYKEDKKLFDAKMHKDSLNSHILVAEKPFVNIFPFFVENDEGYVDENKKISKIEFEYTPQKNKFFLDNKGEFMIYMNNEMYRVGKDYIIRKIPIIG